MNPFRTLTVLALVALAAAQLTSSPARAGSFDGTWEGKSNNMELQLLVKDTSFTGTFKACSAAGTRYSIKGEISETGTIHTFIGGKETPGLARREMQGTLPNIALTGGGSCGPVGFALQKAD